MEDLIEKIEELMPSGKFNKPIDLAFSPHDGALYMLEFGVAWGPNPEAVAGMLRAVGFRRVEVVTPDSRAYRLARTVRRLPRYAWFAARHRVRPFEHPGQGRAVFHAFR